MKSPIKSIYWKKLNDDYKRMKNIHLFDIFTDPNRFQNFSINYKNRFLFDFSKNIIDDISFRNLISFAKDLNLEKEIENMFTGKIINKTENRPVLHTALRDFSENPLIINNQNIKTNIKNVLNKMKEFDILFNKNKYTDIVNIGIGGSDLGVKMTCNALKKISKKNINVHFVSNVDLTEIKDVLENINLKYTLFIICSKTFTTQETIINANYAKNYFIENLKKHDISKNFVAVSTNISEVIKFGIDENNIFEFWDWVGGRFSIWSSIGLSLCLYIGYDNFIQLLSGASEIDNHFKETPFEKNIPIIMGLISIFYTNFFNYQSTAVICYSQRMKYFVPYLQQCIMESNGKSVDRNNKFVNYQTGNIIWGGVGTDTQHSFFQFLHQGTKIIPTDFITFVDNLEENKVLISNFLAQTHSLAFGRNEMKGKISTEENVNNIINHKIFKGNRPSNSLIFKELNPYNLGMLMAIYEHKTFVEGILWNIFSFDQWGVELGKTICSNILSKFDNKLSEKLDSSTEGLINFIKS